MGEIQTGDFDSEWSELIFSFGYVVTVRKQVMVKSQKIQSDSHMWSNNRAELLYRPHWEEKNVFCVICSSNVNGETCMK